MQMRERKWWFAVTIVVAAGATAAALVLTTSGTAKPPPLSSHSFANPAGGLLRLDVRLAAMLDTGQAPGAAKVNLAAVNCGPRGARLQADSDVECGLTASVGSAVMIVRITAPDARRFAIVEIGSSLGPLTGAARLADVACHTNSHDLCAPEGRAPQYPSKPLGGGSTPGPGVPGIMPCVGGPRAQPTEIVLACADFNSYVDKLSWSIWTTCRAVGRGTLVENDCTPSCVAGKFYSYRVVVELGKAVPTHYGLLFTTYKVIADAPIRPMRSGKLTGTLATTPG